MLVFVSLPRQILFLQRMTHGATNLSNALVVIKVSFIGNDVKRGLAKSVELSHNLRATSCHSVM